MLKGILDNNHANGIMVIDNADGMLVSDANGILVIHAMCILVVDPNNITCC